MHYRPSYPSRLFRRKGGPLKLDLDRAGRLRGSDEKQLCCSHTIRGLAGSWRLPAGAASTKSAANATGAQQRAGANFELEVLTLCCQLQLQLQTQLIRKNRRELLRRSVGTRAGMLCKCDFERDFMHVDNPDF